MTRFSPPAIGEFFSGHGSEIEAMALAVPIDALEGPPPPELEELSVAADDLVGATSSGGLEVSCAAEQAVARAWDTYSRGMVPPRIAKEVDRTLDELAAAIKARDQAQTGNAAIDVAQSTLDLKLRHLPPTEIDRARFELWTHQVLVDAAADNLGGVGGDIATLEWIRDRFDDTLDSGDLARIDTPDRAS